MTMHELTAESITQRLTERRSDKAHLLADFAHVTSNRPTVAAHALNGDGPLLAALRATGGVGTVNAVSADSAAGLLLAHLSGRMDATG